MRLAKLNLLLTFSAALLAGCGGQEGPPSSETPEPVINQPLRCGSYYSASNILLSADSFPGSDWLANRHWTPVEMPASWVATAYSDEFGRQQDLRVEQPLTDEFVQLGLFYPSHTYRLTLDVKSANAGTEANASLSLLNRFADQLMALSLVDATGIVDEWQTLQADIDFQSTGFPTLWIQSDADVQYRNLKLQDLTESGNLPYDYQQIVGNYVAQGWSALSLWDIGDWTDEVLGTSVSQVDWDPYDGIMATCGGKDAPNSTDYRFPSLAPGHRYELVAYLGDEEFPLDQVKLVAYGSIQSKLGFIDADSEPVFLRKEIHGTPTVNETNAQVRFEVDSRHMTSLNLQLTSGVSPVNWIYFKLTVMD